MVSDRPGAGAEALSAADAERLAEIMQALASPVRLRILSALRVRPSTVTELGEQLGMVQPAVSNHLRLLRHLSLVAARRDGRYVHYALSDRHVEELLSMAVGHLAHISADGERAAAPRSS